MKIAITGHTSGLGEDLFKTFSNLRHSVIGFSRTTGHNIDSAEDRRRILDQLDDCDVFINNAYSNFNNSQLFMLKEVFQKWHGLNRTIINISTRYTNNLKDPYCLTKMAQDKFCEDNIYNLPRILNVKPGLIDTPRVKDIQGNKLTTSLSSSIILFSLTNCVQSITFGQ